VDKVYLSLSLGFLTDDPVLTFQALPMELVAFSSTKTIVACSLRIARKSATDRSAANIASIIHFSPFTFRLSPAIEMAGYHCQAPLGLPSIHFFTFHFSPFTFLLSAVWLSVVGGRSVGRRRTKLSADGALTARRPRTDDAQTADNRQGKRHSTDAQTADYRCSDGGQK